MYVEGELAVGQIIMFPRVPSWRAVWRAIQLWWFCLHGFEHSCEEIGETNPKHCSEQRHIRSFAGLLKALSLRPTFQPTSTPEQASRLLRCKGDSWTNVLQFGLPWGKFNLLLTFSTDAKHRTAYCSSVCSIPSYGLLFVLTSFSFAPSTLFGFCFCSFQRKPGCHSIGPSCLSSKICGGIGSLWQGTTQLVQVWSEKPFLSFSKRFLVAICRAQPRAGWKCIWERLVWNPLQASTGEHSWICLMIPIPAALVCPKTCDTVAEDACNIASHLSIDHTHDEREYSGKRGILRQSWSRHVRELPNLFKCEVRSPSFLFPRDSWLQFAGHSHVQVESVYEKGLFETLYKQALGNIHESVSWFLSQQHWSVPRHVILWQKMLVTLPVTFPSTTLTMSENTQASEVYWGSLEADMSENYPTCSSVKWEVLPLFCLKVSWMQFAGHSQVQVASVYGNGLFETLYKQALGNIDESPWLMIPTPAALVCPKTYDTVAEDACNIASHLSIDLTHRKCFICRQNAR